MLGGQALRDGVHIHRAVAQVAGAFGGDDHTRQRAVGLQAVVEEAERLADPAGGHVHLAGQRPVVHDRGRVLVGAVAAGERDVEEVVPGRAVLVHVAPGEDADLVGGPQKTEGAGPLGRSGQLDSGVPPRAGTRTALARAPGDTHARLAGGDGRRQVRDGRARTAAAVTGLGEEGHVTGADRLGDLHLVGLLHGVRGERVHLGRRDPRVVQRRDDRPARQRAFGLRQPLGERRLAGPGYHRRVLEGRPHRHLRGRPSVLTAEEATANLTGSQLPWSGRLSRGRLCDAR